MKYATPKTHEYQDHSLQTDKLRSRETGHGEWGLESI